MHADEVEIDTELVRTLIASQFAQWNNLPIQPIETSGTNNALFKLGDHLVVRLPRIPSAVKHIDRERTWLPKLASHLSVAIPVPHGLGKPDQGFTWPWTVYSFLEGNNPLEGAIEAPNELAQDLASFISELHKIPVDKDAPAARRGKPLNTQNVQVQQALKELEDVIDIEAAAAIWQKCLAQEEWQKDPVWVHGDLMPGNLLIKENRLSGVCDFEGVGVGDPACDLISAWDVLPASVRQTFKEAVNVDEATWERGKGWAFSMALIQLPYYKDTNLVMAANARYTIDAVLNSK